MLRLVAVEAALLVKLVMPPAGVVEEGVVEGAADGAAVVGVAEGAAVVGVAEEKEEEDQWK